MPKIFLFKYDRNLRYLSLKCWDIWNSREFKLQTFSLLIKELLH